MITDNTNAIVWETKTSLRHPKLTMHNNGNLELFNDFTNRVYWASNTTERKLIKNFSQFEIKKLNFKF